MVYLIIGSRCSKGGFDLRCDTADAGVGLVLRDGQGGADRE